VLPPSAVHSKYAGERSTRSSAHVVTAEVDAGPVVVLEAARSAVYDLAQALNVVALSITEGEENR
jgi:folate-dependent phosphoribosylglycinamide formyltransferase PurN